MQEKGCDLHTDIFTRFFEVFHRGIEVEFRQRYIVSDLHPGEKGHAGCRLETGITGVTVEIGVIQRGRHTPIAERLSRPRPQVRQAAEFGGMHFYLLTVEGNLPLFDLDIVVKGVFDTLAE